MALTSKSAKAIFESRKLIKTSDEGSTVKMRLQGSGNVIDVTRTDGSLVVDENSGDVLRKMIHNTKFNSEAAVNAAPNKELLKNAIVAEKSGDAKLADELFNKYLNKVQFSFSVLSTQSMFGKLSANQRVEGTVERIDTDNGTILTIDPKTIVVLEAAEVTASSVWGVEAESEEKAPAALEAEATA